MEAAWWTPLEEFTKLRNANDACSADDFLLPAPAKNRGRFAAKPCGNSQASKWLKSLLAESSVKMDTQTIQDVTLSAFRVFLPNWAHYAAIDESRRVWLGRWTEPKMVDTYTRQHRNMVLGIMKELMHKRTLDPDMIDKSAGALVPEDLHHAHWELADDAAQEEDAPPDLPAMPALEEALPERPEKVLREWHEVPPSEGGPFWLGYNVKKTGIPPLHKLHIFDMEGVAVGCKWAPRSDQYDSFFENDYNVGLHKMCDYCWKPFVVPQEWEHKEATDSESCDSNSEDNADSEQEDFVEEEQIAIPKILD